MRPRFDDQELVTTVEQKEAGHFLAVAPYLPLGLDETGATPAATHQARVDFWDAVDEVLSEAKQ
ncbi:hypothetical protein D3C74_480790 [compost metagenome]